ncbi:hypothetical protein [Actinomadura rudentiformis]|uniref:Uncharacterized protein n=1 Tax=Actinomadura rudentiformis TaxID=359158 RepID=A0A6H9Z1C4_9ACTN|nr:hypothetical protein [Actinomadura rudentiformis]KAB2351595.1 hypothetical protein F8566_05055 [Actinomadura rudentiformis]
MTKVRRADLPAPPRVAVDPDLPERLRDRIQELNPRVSPKSADGHYVSWDIDNVDGPDYFERRRLKRSVVVGIPGVGAFMFAHQSANPFGLWLTPDLSGLASVLGWAHDAVLVIALVALFYPVLWLAKTVSGGFAIGENYSQKQLRRAHGHFIGSHDLDGASAELLTRTQCAVDTVLNSDVNEAGLLDSVHNQVALPMQEWEIAKALRGLSRLRRKHPDVVVDEMASAATVAQQTAAEAHDKLVRRVEALEEYAELVKAADATYHLAAAHDQIAEAEVDDLTDRARVAGQTLQDSVHRALEAAQVVVSDPA